MPTKSRIPALDFPNVRVGNTLLLIRSEDYGRGIFLQLDRRNRQILRLRHRRHVLVADSLHHIRAILK